MGIQGNSIGTPRALKKNAKVAKDFVEERAMKREYHKWWSPSLERDMEMLVLGHDGLPAVVFPASQGRFYEFEDRGMVDAVR